MENRPQSYYIPISDNSQESLKVTIITQRLSQLLQANTARVQVLPTCSEAVKYPVFAQNGVAVGANEDSCLGISEDVIFL